MGFLRKINIPLRKLGFELGRFNPGANDLARRKQLMDTFEIDLVLDVGANSGYFAGEIRELGYTSRIVSFEPLTSAFKALTEQTANDDLWQAVNLALGNENIASEINISANSFSSSILKIHSNHVESAPASAVISKESIQVRRLDTVWPEYVKGDENVYLKIDTQGFEKQVLQGAEGVLNNIKIIQLEMSLRTLYEGAASFDELNSYLLQQGFELVSLETGFTDVKTGILQQVDGVYRRV